MELLARNFLASVVERTDSPDQRDIDNALPVFHRAYPAGGNLRRWPASHLKFTHWMRTDFTARLSVVEAMAELAGRTAKESHNIAEISPALPSAHRTTAPASHHAG